MDNISLIAEEVRERIYEVNCLMKCFFDVFEVNVIHQKDCLFLLPLAKTAFTECKKLADNFDELDDAICKKSLKIED